MTRRGLDHVVIAVPDLDAARAAYARLGFTLTPVGRHPFGTANSLVQLDGAFLELLAVVAPDEVPEPTPARFSFAAFNRDRLAADGAGATMLVLDSGDADADLADFRAQGLASFERVDFGRTAVGPDGTPREVAFSLAFTQSPELPTIGFFTCHNRYPENFWNARYQHHANGARSLAGAILVADDPADHHAFLAAFAGQREMRSTSAGIEIATARGVIEVLTPAAFAWRGGERGGKPGRIRGLRLSVDDLASARTRLASAGIPCAEHHGSLVVGPDAALGVTLFFEAAATAP